LAATFASGGFTTADTPFVVAPKNQVVVVGKQSDPKILEPVPTFEMPTNVIAKVDEKPAAEKPAEVISQTAVKEDKIPTDKPTEFSTQVVAKEDKLQVDKPVDASPQVNAKGDKLSVDNPVEKPTQAVAKEDELPFGKATEKPTQVVEKEEELPPGKATEKPTQMVEKEEELPPGKATEKLAQFFMKDKESSEGSEQAKEVDKPTTTVQAETLDASKEDELTAEKPVNKNAQILAEKEEPSKLAEESKKQDEVPAAAVVETPAKVMAKKDELPADKPDETPATVLTAKEDSSVISKAAEKVDVPEVSDLKGSVSKTFQNLNVPDTSDLTGAVSKAFGGLNVPGVLNLKDSVSKASENLNVPDASDVAAAIPKSADDLKAPDTSNIKNSFSRAFGSLNAPDLSGLTGAVSKRFENVKVPDASNLKNSVSKVTENLRVLDTSDLTDTASKAIEKLKAPDVSGLTGAVSNRFESVNVPGVSDLVGAASKSFENLKFPDFSELGDALPKDMKELSRNTPALAAIGATLAAAVFASLSSLSKGDSSKAADASQPGKSTATSKPAGQISVDTPMNPPKTVGANAPAKSLTPLEKKYGGSSQTTVISDASQQPMTTSKPASSTPAAPEPVTNPGRTEVFSGAATTKFAEERKSKAEQLLARAKKEVARQKLKDDSRVEATAPFSVAMPTAPKEASATTTAKSLTPMERRYTSSGPARGKERAVESDADKATAPRVSIEKPVASTPDDNPITLKTDSKVQSETPVISQPIPTKDADRPIGRTPDGKPVVPNIDNNSNTSAKSLTPLEKKFAAEAAVSKVGSEKSVRVIESAAPENTTDKPVAKPSTSKGFSKVTGSNTGTDSKSNDSKAGKTIPGVSVVAEKPPTESVSSKTKTTTVAPESVADSQAKTDSATTPAKSVESDADKATAPTVSMEKPAAPTPDDNPITLKTDSKVQSETPIISKPMPTKDADRPIGRTPDANPVVPNIDNNSNTSAKSLTPLEKKFAAEAVVSKVELEKSVRVTEPAAPENTTDKPVAKPSAGKGFSKVTGSGTGTDSKSNDSKAGKTLPHVSVAAEKPPTESVSSKTKTTTVASKSVADFLTKTDSATTPAKSLTPLEKKYASSESSSSSVESVKPGTAKPAAPEKNDMPATPMPVANPVTLQDDRKAEYDNLGADKHAATKDGDKSPAPRSVTKPLTPKVDTNANASAKSLTPLEKKFAQEASTSKAGYEKSFTATPAPHKDSDEPVTSSSVSKPVTPKIDSATFAAPKSATKSEQKDVTPKADQQPATKPRSVDEGAQVLKADPVPAPNRVSLRPIDVDWEKSPTPSEKDATRTETGASSTPKDAATQSDTQESGKASPVKSSTPLEKKYASEAESSKVRSEKYGDHKPTSTDTDKSTAQTFDGKPVAQRSDGATAPAKSLTPLEKKHASEAAASITRPEKPLNNEKVSAEKNTDKPDAKPSPSKDTSNVSGESSSYLDALSNDRNGSSNEQSASASGSKNSAANKKET